MAMPLQRQTLARAATLSRALATPSKSLQPTIQSRALSSTQRQQSADSHGDHYDPPSGWLWGNDPSKKHEKEGWETIYMVGMFGTLGLAAVAYAFKPDTSIQTWALEEARRRLEAEGILKEPEDKS